MLRRLEKGEAENEAKQEGLNSLTTKYGATVYNGEMILPDDGGYRPGMEPRVDKALKDSGYAPEPVVGGYRLVNLDDLPPTDKPKSRVLTAWPH